MMHQKVHGCRLTLALLANMKGDPRAKFEEMLRLALEEWRADPDEVAVQLMTNEDGLEIELHVEEDGPDCTVIARIEKPGVYKIDWGSITVRNVPDTIAMRAISGKACASDLGGSLLDGFETGDVIRKGIVYKNGEKIDDLTGISSSPPWDKDMSLTLCFGEDEGWKPLDLPDGNGNLVRLCPLVRLFLKEDAEDFKACFRYVLENGETKDGDEGYVLFRRGETDHAVNGEILHTEYGEVLSIFLVIGIMGRFYLQHNEATIYALPASVIHANHVGKTIGEILTTELPYPPAEALVTHSRPTNNANGLLVKFESD